MTFHLTCVRIIFSSVFGCLVATIWEIAAHSLNICCLCVLTSCNISYFPFWL